MSMQSFLPTASAMNPASSIAGMATRNVEDASHPTWSSVMAYPSGPSGSCSCGSIGETHPTTMPKMKVGKEAGKTGDTNLISSLY